MRNFAASPGDRATLLMTVSFTLQAPGPAEAYRHEFSAPLPLT